MAIPALTLIPAGRLRALPQVGGLRLRLRRSMLSGNSHRAAVALAPARLPRRAVLIGMTGAAVNGRASEAMSG